MRNLFFFKASDLFYWSLEIGQLDLEEASRCVVVTLLLSFERQSERAVVRQNLLSDVVKMMRLL